MKLILGDREYHQDVTRLYQVSLGEARAIKRQTGLTISDWRVGLMTLNREDPDVLAALAFLFQSRSGVTVDWDELDTIDSQDLLKGLEFEESDRESLVSLLPPRAAEAALATLDRQREEGDAGMAETAESGGETNSATGEATESATAAAVS